MTFLRSSDCGVSDCQILDPLHQGLELEDCVRCRVANNTIVDRRKQPKMRHAIRVLGQSRDNLITNDAAVAQLTRASMTFPRLMGSGRFSISCTIVSAE